MGGYGLLTALACRAMGGGLLRPLPLRSALLAVLASTLYGVSDEIHQCFVPGRTSEVKDVLSDLAGAALAAALVFGGTRLVSKRSGPSSSPSGFPPKVTLYTREGCHLCHEARRLLEEERHRHPFELEVLDVDAEPGLAERFGEQVPVVFLQGRKAFKYRVDPRRLRRRLDAARRGRTA